MIGIAELAGVLGFLVVAAFWAFLLWALFMAMNTLREMRAELRRIGDHLERLVEERETR